MSVHEIPMYEIVCDEPGCEFKTLDVSSEYSAWAEAGTARDEWVDADQQEIDAAGVLTHYCDEHRRLVCVDCNATEGLVLDEPDGDLYCPACRERLTAAARVNETEVTR